MSEGCGHNPHGVGGAARRCGSMSGVHRQGVRSQIGLLQGLNSEGIPQDFSDSRQEGFPSIPGFIDTQ